jgi:hypothetical protein
LVTAILTNSERYSDQDLQELALEDSRNGGKGRANAMLALPIDFLTNVYLAMSPQERNLPITVEGHRLDGNISTVLEHVLTPKYQRL